MPENSAVGRVYDALVGKRGMSKEKAAKIAQAKTGENLKYGLPIGQKPKGKKKPAKKKDSKKHEKSESMKEMMREKRMKMD